MNTLILMNSSKVNELFENISKHLRFSQNTFNCKSHELNVEKIIRKTGFSKNTKDKYHYKSQPFGSQKSPDFRIFDGIDYIDIECKSRKIGYKPMWNSCIPNKHTYYIYSNQDDNKTLIIKGEEIVSDKLLNVMNEYKTRTKQLEQEYNNKINKLLDTENPYKLNVYARNMFVQKKHFTIKK